MKVGKKETIDIDVKGERLQQNKRLTEVTEDWKSVRKINVRIQRID